MPVTTIDYTTAAGASTTTTRDTGTYSVTQVTEGLSIPPYDFIGIAYVAAGNGAGEIQTITYRDGGASGQIVATLNHTYDSNNRLITVSRS